MKTSVRQKQTIIPKIIPRKKVCIPMHCRQPKGSVETSIPTIKCITKL